MSGPLKKPPIREDGLTESGVMRPTTAWIGIQGLSVICVQKVPLSKLLISLINILGFDYKLLISIDSLLSGRFFEFDAVLVR
jgi:hypothetical protein